MNAADVQRDHHDAVVLIKYEPRSAGGSWEEPVTAALRGSPLRRSARLNSTLDNRSSNQLRSTLSRARELCERWRSGGGAGAGGGCSPADETDAATAGRLSRWFSVRRGSHHHYDVGGESNGLLGDKMPKVPELDEDLSWCGGSVGECLVSGGAGGRRCPPPPALPPAPPNASPQQLRRRHIVAAVLHSENSYVATLQRLVNDYKKPLEDSSPVILNAGKVGTLFHRLPEILQCHLHFRTALADCAKTWDRDEKIGEVFLSAFSKAVVLDVYSDFINNFSVAMDLAKMESKRKSALADFFKVKQISAHDRLSFFGLMVKPVQRFPQFIMFLQDLLKYTPPGHPDRLSLQRALTRLEALADALNERKRDAERTQAFRAAMRRLGARGAGAGATGAPGRFASARLLAAQPNNRHLIRQDDVEQLEFNQAGLISKCKPRRLLLLNDLVVCVSVQARNEGAGPEADTERLSLKWAHPVNDVEVVDTGSSPTLSRVLAAGMNRGGSLRSSSSVSSSSSSSASAGESLCGEMSTLMHDYETVSRMHDASATLRGTYPDITPAVLKKVMQQIQQSIQKKDDEMAWLDSCCLQLSVRASAGKGGKEESFTLRTGEPSARLAWATELRLAQLARAPANRPAWRPPAKHKAAPLYVATQPVYCSQHLTEIRCGCFYISSGGVRRSRALLWLCAADGASSHVAVLLQTGAKLKPLLTFDLVETKVNVMEFVKGARQASNLCGDTVWLGTESRKLLLYAAVEPEKQERLAELTLPDSITQLRYHCDAVFTGLANGTLLHYRRANDNTWSLNDPVVLNLGSQPIRCILPINGIVYASCGLKVHVINGLTAEIIRTCDVQCDKITDILAMAHSGVGLWVALSNSTAVRLYHSETFEHIQDIDIAADVARTIGARDGTKPAHVSALLACQGLLWVGTTAGVSITIPLPRLEGLPLISGQSNVSYHAHAGPVTFLLSLLPENRDCDPNLVRRNISNARKETNNNTSVDSTTTDAEKSNDKVKFDRQISEESTISLTPSKHLRGSIISTSRRRRGLYDTRLSKTLPRSANLGANDVYGLYGDLMFVKDCANESDMHGSGGENLRRSDPELAAIPFRVSTLDRRLRMKAGRPRSLDLSSWSVDSRSSSLCTSSGSEESMALRSISRNSSNASRTNEFNTNLNIYNNSLHDTSSSKSSASDITPDKSVSRSNSLVKDTIQECVSTTGTSTPAKQNVSNVGRSIKPSDFLIGANTRRSVITLMGGRGYVDWRQTAEAADRPTPSAEPNPKDAHIIVWEMRL